MNGILTVGIALANNLDNTGVGIAYGVGRIRIPVRVNLWISVITFIITGAAVAVGAGVGDVIAPIAAKVLSATILCGIGAVIASSSFRKTRSSRGDGGNVLQRVLDDPRRADADGSSHIDFREGTLLGFALSINNVGGGLGAGLVHLSVVWTALLSAIFSFAVLWAGGLLGLRVGLGRFASQAPIIAGALLIAIGVCQLRN